MSLLVALSVFMLIGPTSSTLAGGERAGEFTIVSAGLVDAENSSVAWGDYDGDSDLDLVVAGYTGSTRVTTVYANDGGVFTDIVAGLPGTYYGDTDWGDFDNDGDLDLL
ncbi:VCBS repeat-containing protein, partial [bacterium]|nr:VCBS repeat-containing protein [candidate division CSSED10-310 bacterium]